MTHPQSFNREEVKRAYKTLWDIFNTACYSLDTEEQERELKKELEDNVMRFLPDEPKPNMAECAWDDKEHYLAEVKVCKNSDDDGIYTVRTAMMLKEVSDNAIAVMSLDDIHIDGIFNFRKEKLVPTGVRYKIVEDDKQD